MNEKIYVIAPYYNTGGPKSLHQLANLLVDHGKTVYVVYYKGGVPYKTREKLFDFCKAEIADEVEDLNCNTVVTSEYYSGVILKYRNVRKYIWWLSLDFYLQNKLFYRALFSLRNKGLPVALTPMVMLYKMVKKDWYKPTAYIKRKEDFQSIFHLYNCEYAHKYLAKMGVKEENAHYLCGPLEESYLSPDKTDILRKKENIVVYNPAKINASFLEKIQCSLDKITNNIEFIPIKNMSRSEVYETLCRSKVYIDFGYFPGPERMPREAASLYCNIITSNLGSARNDYDVPIPRKFKFGINYGKVDEIAKLIYDMCTNFETYTSEFDVYREKVRSQILNFEHDIEEVFDN